MKKIDEYNQHPNMCKCCNKPILASYDKKLSDVKRKIFCSRSCAATFNNSGVVHNEQGAKSIIDKYSDDDIIEAFNSSGSLTEFSRKLGYKYKVNLNNRAIYNRLQQLNLNVNDLKPSIDICTLTKEQFFNRYKQWQTARSIISKMARQVFNASDKPKKCVICGYDKHYEVAHIKAVSSFCDSALISSINDIDNLVALCPNHHWEYDNNILDIASVALK